MTKQTKWQRVAPGSYECGGWTISRLPSGSWCLLNPDGSAQQWASSLADAKALAEGSMLKGTNHQRTDLWMVASGVAVRCACGWQVVRSDPAEARETHMLHVEEEA